MILVVDFNSDILQIMIYFIIDYPDNNVNENLGRTLIALTNINDPILCDRL